MQNSIQQDLLALSHELGREDRGLAILGEGNASARLGGETFVVKASGACLGALKEDEIVKCRVSALLPMLETENLTDQQVDDALLAARAEPRAKKPSVEAVFHAWLLSLPGVNFAGHTQSVALEMAPFNVRCNAVCPGNLLDSPLWTHPEKGLFAQYLRAGKIPGAKNVDDVRQAYINQVPMKRGCAYEDVCNAVVFLASGQSSYITGIALSVTGGQEMS